MKKVLYQKKKKKTKTNIAGKFSYIARFGTSCDDVIVIFWATMLSHCQRKGIGRMLADFVNMVR